MEENAKTDSEVTTKKHPTKKERDGGKRGKSEEVKGDGDTFDGINPKTERRNRRFLPNNGCPLMPKRPQRVARARSRFRPCQLPEMARTPALLYFFGIFRLWAG